MNCFCFEIITKREVTKHFEKCTVTCSFTYVLDITCTDTFLAGTYSCSRRNLCTCKIWFQRSHTCIDQQKTLISLWYQGKAFHYQMSFTLHKVEEHLTKFVYSVFLHNLFLLKSDMQTFLHILRFIYHNTLCISRPAFILIYIMLPDHSTHFISCIILQQSY